MSSRRVWTEEEDQAIKELVGRHGHKNWANVAAQLSDQFGTLPRSGKQCRQRWHNHLNPGIEKRVWSKVEEEKMFSLHKVFGNKWTVIAQALPGRTDNSIKNYFYSTIRRSLRRMGKFVGSKNSTEQMKHIKPSTLSKIFEASSEPQQETQTSTKQFQLMSLIKDNCETVRDSIIKFTNYKPKRSDKANQLERTQFEEVINKMVYINQIYEKIKGEEKHQKHEEMTFRKDQGKLMLSDQSFEEQQSPSGDPMNEISPEQRDIDVFGEKLSENKNKKRGCSVLGKARTNKLYPVTPATEIKSVESTFYTVPTVIIKSHNCLSQNQNPEYGQTNENPDFFVELKDEMPDLLSRRRSNFGFQSPGLFFNTPSNNPFNFFQSPSTSKSYDSSFGGLGAIQNNTLDDFKHLIQRQIEGNLSGECKLSVSTTTIGCSPGSAFSVYNFP